MVDGQAAYLRTLAAALADRPNFIDMTVGNEVDQFAAGPHPDPGRAATEEIDTWLRRNSTGVESTIHTSSLHTEVLVTAEWVD